MLQEGLYHGKLVKSGTGVSKGEGKSPFIFATFTVGHIAVAVPAGQSPWVPLPKPEERTVSMYLTDAAYATTEKKLEALGFNGDFVNPAFDPAVTSTGVELRCKHESYTPPAKPGQPAPTAKNSEKWELENWGGREVDPIQDQSFLQVLSARYRQARPAAGGAAPAAPSVPAGAMPGQMPAGAPPMQAAPVAAPQVLQTAVGAFPTNHPGSPQAAPAPAQQAPWTHPAGVTAPGAAPQVAATGQTAPSSTRGGPPPPAVNAPQVQSGFVQGAPPAMANMRTRDQVWEAATKAHPTAPTDVLAMRWAEGLARLRPGKAEPWTPEEYYALEQWLVAPF